MRMTKCDRCGDYQESSSKRIAFKRGDRTHHVIITDATDGLWSYAFETIDLCHKCQLELSMMVMEWLDE